MRLLQLKSHVYKEQMSLLLNSEESCLLILVQLSVNKTLHVPEGKTTVGTFLLGKVHLS